MIGIDHVRRWGHGAAGLAVSVVGPGTGAPRHCSSALLLGTAPRHCSSALLLDGIGMRGRGCCCRLADAPGLFVAAALLSLPSSIVAVPAYYVLYGVTALIPGANPSSGSGEGSVAPDGDTVTIVAGDPAAWFTMTTSLLAVLLLAAAAWLNAVAFTTIRSRMRASQSGIR